MPATLTQANRQAQIESPLGPDVLVLTKFTAMERLSEPFSIVVDVVMTSGDPASLQSHLGDKVSIELLGNPQHRRYFHGRLWDVTELGTNEQGLQLRLTLKPWCSFLDINCESRIYQQKNVLDIVRDVAARRVGVTPLLRLPSGSYPPLEYCVQWQESDFDFITRLFERHGIYYYFEHSAANHELIAVDNKNSHADNAGLGDLEVLPPDQTQYRDGSLWSFTRRYEVAPFKSAVTDYDFTTPNTALKADTASVAKTLFDRVNGSELYVHPGGFTKPLGDGRGQQISDRLIEAARADADRSLAEGDVTAACVGKTVLIKGVKYLITATTHHYAGNNYASGGSEQDELSVELELIPATVQYRAPMKTPRPRIYGPQTALVTGTAGEEIDTDKYGRIKVRFYWDRVGTGGPTSSCWIRVAQSMAGGNWGGFVLPRIGQEVVIEYVGGDPDQPLVTGVVYNEQNMPPYPLPDNKTRTTFKSRSSKGSSGFNELRMEDKAGSEEVFFNAEKDLNSIVDKGNETRTLNKGHRTTTIKEGNETLLIEKGNRSDTLNTGNDTLLLKQGNRTATLDTGNDSVTIKTGNQTIKIDLGKQTTEATTSIELKCGASTIKLEPAKITISSVMIEIKGSAMVKTEGAMVQSQASGISILKGSMVMIN